MTVKSVRASVSTLLTRFALYFVCFSFIFHVVSSDRLLVSKLKWIFILINFCYNFCYWIFIRLYPQCMCILVIWCIEESGRVFKSFLYLLYPFFSSIASLTSPTFHSSVVSGPLLFPLPCFFLFMSFTPPYRSVVLLLLSYRTTKKEGTETRTMKHRLFFFTNHTTFIKKSSLVSKKKVNWEPVHSPPPY